MKRVGDIVKACADMPCEFIVAASGASVVRQRDQDYGTGVRDIHVTDTVERDYKVFHNEVYFYANI